MKMNKNTTFIKLIKTKLTIIHLFKAKMISVHFLFFFILNISDLRNTLLSYLFSQVEFFQEILEKLQLDKQYRKDSRQILEEK